MNEFEVFLRLAFAGLALIMLGLSLVSLWNTREMKMGLASAGFGIFAAEGIMLAMGIFVESIESAVTPGYLVGLNFLALVLLYLSIVKR